MLLLCVKTIEKTLRIIWRRRRRKKERKHFGHLVHDFLIPSI